MTDTTDKRAALDFLLNQSSIYSKIIGEKISRERADRQTKEDKATKRQKKQSKPEVTESVGKNRATRSGHRGVRPGKTASRQSGIGKKREEVELNEIIDEKELERAATKSKSHDDDATTQRQGFQQPKLVSGATLKSYQLDGVAWMLSLYSNGLSGILADEMGLGKTIQTITFLAYLRENGVPGPYLVVCPLSTVANWINEFERFTPDIPVLLYHGTPQERAVMRAEELGLAGSTPVKGQKKHRANGKPKINTPSPETFPIIVTSYEMVMNDRIHLSKIPFKYIVVDESHRLKNLDCKLIRELKKYTSANRMLLTGTPLHNNLAELWSLLNFILPDIFDDLDSFQQWFDFDDVGKEGGHERILSEEISSQIVTKLHSILKPFLLRRLKRDVEQDLPPKKEYLLYAPLTSQQKELYDAVAGRTIRRFLIDRKTGDDTPATSNSESHLSTPSSVTEDTVIDLDELHVRAKRGKKRRRIDYEEKSDDDYFESLERWDVGEDEEEESMAERAVAFQRKLATKSVNNMKLQNLVMQLRKVCDHPWLFDWPIDEQTGQSAINKDLVNASGKMLLLDKLLSELFSRGHKVLLFSQFTSMLDIIHDWAEEFKHYKVCRIDGSTKQTDRREQMKAFNEPDSEFNLFLLSTRAGGVGINLVAADTVILFDSDWNPQMDRQAQDRAHRIGQTKPVLVFRFCTAATIESRILAKADSKRKLEALVIGDNKFKFGPSADVDGFLGGGGDRKRKQKMRELAQALLSTEGEQVMLAEAGDEIISKSKLDQLLDRSDAAMSRGKGWKSEAKESGFEVFESAMDAEDQVDEDEDK